MHPWLVLLHLKSVENTGFSICRKFYIFYVLLSSSLVEYINSRLIKFIKIE